MFKKCYFNTPLWNDLRSAGCEIKLYSCHKTFKHYSSFSAIHSIIPVFVDCTSLRSHNAQKPVWLFPWELDCRNTCTIMMFGPLSPRQSLAMPFIWLKSTAGIYSKQRFTWFHFTSTPSKSRCKLGFRILTGVLIHRLSASVFACRCKEMFCCFLFLFQAHLRAVGHRHTGTFPRA